MTNWSPGEYPDQAFHQRRRLMSQFGDRPEEPRHCQCGCTERRDYFGNYDLCPLFERALEEYADAMEPLKEEGECAH